MLLVAALAPTAFAFPDCPYGVVAHVEGNDELQRAADAGVRWIRIDVNWNQVEPSRGSYDWSEIDRVVDSADRLGLGVYATLAYTPSWAVSGSCNDSSDDDQDWCHNRQPADDRYWTDFVTTAVNRYSGRVTHWGMWNEPNVSSFYTGSRDEYVERILVPGSDAVHAACPTCLVLGPDLAPLRSADWDSEEGICAFGECIFNGWEVSLTRILDDAGWAIDVVTHHKYDDDAEVMWDELLDGEWLYGIQYMHGVKEITDDYAPGKPVWITEYGYETEPGGELTEVEAADELTETFSVLDAVSSGSWSESSNDPWPELEVLFWYDLQDDPTTYRDGRYTWGLLDSDGNPKEAWYAMEEATARYGGCVEEGEPEDTGEPVHTGEPADTGGSEPGPGDSGGAGDDGGGGTEPVADSGPEVSDDTADPTGPRNHERDPEPSSGCATGGGGSGAWSVLLGALALRRPLAPPTAWWRRRATAGVAGSDCGWASRSSTCARPRTPTGG
ncbi:MAG: beta-galactosidase [Deltaproteobacteria bacterium]|nr:beta-galactosidase [Deltaproteobacteria bacterium]